MSSKRLQDAIRIIKEAIHALSFKYPLSIVLFSILARDFKPLQQSDAYEILVYLINACKEKPILKPIDPQVWKSQDAYSKMSVEKFKKTVLQAVKTLSSDGNERLPALKISDLKLPSCPQFFLCCKGLSSYAISFQLNCLGLLFRVEVAGCSAELADEVRRYILSEKDALSSEMQIYSRTNEKLANDLKYLENELTAMTNLKLYMESELIKRIDSCKYILNKDSLKDKNSRFEALRQASKYADQISTKNFKQLESLRKLSETLSFLNKILEMRRSEPVTIDGQELSANISYETRTYAEKENIILLESGSIKLQGLFTVLLKSLSSCSEKCLPLSHEISPILDIELPSYDACLLERLSIIKLKLEEELSELKFTLGRNLDKSISDKHLVEFFPTISSINFNLNKELEHIRRDPIVDITKINFFINPKNKDIRKTNNSSRVTVPNSTSYKGLLERRRVRRSRSSSKLVSSVFSNTATTNETPRSNNSQQFGTLRSLSTLSTEDSPISTAKGESTKIWESKQLRRRSRSSVDLLTCATTESPSFISTRKEHLSSTPKADIFFVGDKSLSPICMQSFNDPVDDGSPQLLHLNFHESEEQHNSTVASNVSNSLNNISPYRFSASFESEDLRSTFNSSIYFPDISLDSTGIQGNSISDSILS